MSLTLKQHLNAAIRRCGLSTESAYASSSDDAVLRYVDIANEAAADIAKHPWQALRGTHSFTLTTETMYDLPDDFKAFIPDTAYSDSNLEAVDFPTNPSVWHYLQATTGGSGIRIRTRVIGDKIQIYQPNSGDQISIEYLSKHPVLDTDGVTTQERFDADTDTFRLDDEMLTKALVWRIKKLHSLQEWPVDYKEYLAYHMTMRGFDGGAKTVNSDPSDAYDAGPYYDLYRPVPNA